MNQADLLNAIENIVGRAGILRGDALAGRSSGVWSKHPLRALALVRPESTDEIAQLLQVCVQAGQPVVPAGGMTGLAGGHESTAGEILLSTERMNRIERVDAAARTMTVEAGAILERVQDAASSEGLMFALDLGARASCTIGGNIATNAGGVRVLRYGMMREQVLGLEAVLADGTVVSSMFDMLKNNTGYDLRQMFIGSEGTLGVVTRAVLRLHEAPQQIDTLMLSVPSWRQVMGLLRYFDAALPGALGAFEVLWGDYYALNTGEYSDIDPPLAPGSPYYVLMDVMMTNDADGRERLQVLLEDRLEAGDISDGVMAYSEAERAVFWRIRENFEPEQRRYDLIYGHDISLPLESMAEYVDEIRANIIARFPDAAVHAYGHIGDGNLHTSIYPGANPDRAAIDEIVYSPLRGLRGSVSAEHGIGVEKKAYLHYTRSTAEIDLMRRIKQMLDPTNILNPGKLFD